MKDCGEDTCAQVDMCDRHAGYSFEDDDEALECYDDLEELLDYALKEST